MAFSGLAQLVVPPTTDRKALIAAIDGFKAGRGTAVGSALLRALDAIAEVNPHVTRTGVDVSAAARSVVPPRSGYESDIVVLLTDGATTQGVNPIRAAEQAADRRVRVYAIGFGTTGAAPLSCSREQLGSDVFGTQFGGGGQGGPRPSDGPRRSFLALGEPTLQAIADITGGSYHRAADADQLAEVFRNLPAEIEF